MVSISNYVLGQQIIMNVPDTFDYNFFAVMDTFFAQTPYDSAEGGTYHQMERLARRWQDPLSPHGDFTIANNALMQYTNAFNSGVACNQNSGIYNPNWTSLGPFDTPTGVPQGGMGQIHRLVFNPYYNNGSQTIYATTPYGGLWRSWDSGLHWHNVNTDIGIPIASVSDIAISRQDTNVLFISTGDSDGGIRWGLSTPVLTAFDKGIVDFVQTAGMYRSLNNGQTWEAINGDVINSGYVPTPNLLDFFKKTGTIQVKITNSTS